MSRKRKAANHDRSRRVAWARRIAADQRRAVQRAATTLRIMTRQIRLIQPAARTRVQAVGSLQAAGVVTVILPNGRRSRMRIVPAIALIREVNRLRSAVLINERRQAAATARNSRAIAALAAAQTAAVKKLTAEQVKSDSDLRKRLLEGHNRRRVRA